MQQTTFDANSGVFAFTVNHNSPLYVFLNKVPLVPHEGEEVVKYWIHRQEMHMAAGIEDAVIGLEFTYNENNMGISNVTPQATGVYYMESTEANGDVCVIGMDERRVLNRMAEVYRIFHQDMYDESQINAAENNNYYE